jgi:hypothetical protein
LDVIIIRSNLTEKLKQITVFFLLKCGLKWARTGLSSYGCRATAYQTQVVVLMMEKQTKSKTHLVTDQKQLANTVC